MKPIKLSELIEALEFESAEQVTRIDLQNGCVVSVEESFLRAVEEDDGASLGDLPGWQQQELEIARTMAADSGERFVAAPERFDFNEYRHMERFIGTVTDSAAVEQLWRAIKGKGAYRHFKDTAHRLALLKSWFQYRDAALKKFAWDWAEAHEIPVVDDTPPNVT